MSKAKLVWTLAVLNVLLAMVLLWRAAPDNEARAQVARGRGDYIMIPGRIAGGPDTVVYMLDTANGILGGVSYNDNQRGKLPAMKPIDLARIFSAKGG